MSKNNSKNSQSPVQDFDLEDQMRLHKEAQLLRDKRYQIYDRLITAEELPRFGFDIRCSLAQELSDFGEATFFYGVGEYVRFTGNALITNTEGDTLNMTGIVGQIASKANGRIIIATDKGYFGWINPNEYEKISVIENNLNYIN